MKKIITILACAGIFLMSSSFTAKDYAHFPFLCHDQRRDLIDHVERYRDNFVITLHKQYFFEGVEHCTAYDRAVAEVQAVIDGMHVIHDLLNNPRPYEGFINELVLIQHIRQQQERESRRND